MFNKSTNAKITNLNPKIPIQQYIIQFNIPVQDLIIVAVAYSLDYLSENHFPFLLTEGAVLLHEGE